MAGLRVSAAFMSRHPAHWVALGFGSGLSRWAPGTLGTLWGWLSFALLDRWLGGDGGELETCVVLTTAPNDLLARVHDRMPVVIPDGLEEAWLESVDGPALRALEPLRKSLPAVYAEMSKRASTAEAGRFYLLDSITGAAHAE